MDDMKYLNRLLFLGLFVMFLVMSSCSTMSSDGGMGTPAVANSIEGHNDIVLPTDMEWDSKESMAIKTDSFNGGIYHYSGRVDVNSLKAFVIASMVNNKWKQVGEASSKNIVLAFIKPNKTCMVTISEGFGWGFGYTHIDLYVTHGLAAAKGLNPFGEPVN
jgi:hypothetical protein